MNTFETIIGRRSYRGSYSPDRVSRSDLIRIMQAGLAAPSGCNKQTTSLIAVDDPEVVAAVKAVIDPPIAETAPAFICVLTQKTIAYRDRTFYIHDYSAAIENMLLEIEDLGFRSCWYEGHITDNDRICDKIADVLKVPEGYELVCILPVGRALDEPKPLIKKTFNERAWFNVFGENIETERSCGAVVYARSWQGLRFALIRSASGNWGLPKGHMEEGETEQETALREVKEETGLTVTLNSRFRTIEEHPLGRSGRLKEVAYFLGQSALKTAKPRDTKEIRSVEWVSYRKAMRLLAFPGDRRVLRDARQYIIKHNGD